jgi:hypothetical protein
VYFHEWAPPPAPVPPPLPKFAALKVGVLKSESIKIRLKALNIEDFMLRSFVSGFSRPDRGHHK